MRSVEAIVLGGGIAGSATALHLAAAGMETICIERAESERRISPGEVLPPGVRPLLADCGLWEAFQRTAPVASFGVSVRWGSPEIRDWDYIFSPWGKGWHVDRQAFEDVLSRGAKDRGVKWMRGKAVGAVRRVGAQWVVDVAGAPEMVAKWVVFAGGISRTSDPITGERIGHDRLTGLFRYYEYSKDSPAPEPRLYVEAARDGWWYMAPLPSNRMIVVHLTDSDLVRGAGLEEVFMQRLRKSGHLTGRLAGCRPIGGVGLRWAGSSCRRIMGGVQFACVGDAAWTADPLLGRGITKALESARTAADAILASAKGATDATSEYGQRLEAEYAHYLSGLCVEYNREKRWDSPFWNRRRVFKESTK